MVGSMVTVAAHVVVPYAPLAASSKRVVVATRTVLLPTSPTAPMCVMLAVEASDTLQLSVVVAPAAMRDGFAPETLRAMLAALAALGIRLQEGPQACALIAAEECRQREKASLPPEPSPLSEVDVSSFVDEFFTKLDAPKEDIPT